MKDPTENKITAGNSMIDTPTLSGPVEMGAQRASSGGSADALNKVTAIDALGRSRGK